LATQQQQNVILQTQNETDRLQAKAKQKLFQQKLENAEKLAAKEIEKEKGNAPSLGTPPPEVVVAESIDSDSALPPSQNIRRAVRRTVDHIDQSVVVQELPTTDAVCTSTQNICVSQVTGPSVDVVTATAHAQAAAYAREAAPDFSSTTADPGPRQVVHTETTQLKHPVHIPETNSGSVSSRPIGNFVHQPTVAHATSYLTLTTADPGPRQVVHTETTQLKHPVNIPKTNLGSVSSRPIGNFVHQTTVAHATSYLTLTVQTQPVAPPSAMMSTPPPVFTQLTRPLVQSVPQNYASMSATVAHPGAATRPTFVGFLGKNCMPGI